MSPFGIANVDIIFISQKDFSIIFNSFS